MKANGALVLWLFPKDASDALLNGVPDLLAGLVVVDMGRIARMGFGRESGVTGSRLLLDGANHHISLCSQAGRAKAEPGSHALVGGGAIPADGFGVADPAGTRDALLEGGVLVRDMSSLGALRVTVGTRKENDYFLRRLKEVCR